MTDFGAYDRNLPCKNPNCKSHGRPHPNCKCYAGLSEGGDASFCSEPREHDKGCEYFEDGGAVSGLPDASTLSPVSESPGSLPDASTLTPVSEGLPDASTLSPVDDYESLPQKALTAAEGATHGFLPGASLLETGLSKLGFDELSPEKQAARQETNPALYEGSKLGGVAASLLLPTGPLAQLGRAAEGAAALAGASAVASRLVGGAITNGVIQGGDEVSKWLLGHGDQEHPVGAAIASIGGAALLGAAGSGLSLGLDTAKLGSKFTSFMGGFGSGASPEAELKAIGMLIKDGEVSQKAFDYGQKAYHVLASPLGGAIIGGATGAHYGGLEGALQGAFTGAAFGYGEHKAKLLSTVILKAMSFAPKEANIGSILRDALDHATAVDRGMAQRNKEINAVFKSTSMNAFSEWRDPVMRKKLQDYIYNGGYNQNIDAEMESEGINKAAAGFAKGGDVKKEPKKTDPKDIKSVSEMSQGLQKIYPEQNVLMNAARGRVSEYLKNMQPPRHTVGLAFDTEHKNPEPQRNYDTATDIAVNPLGVLHEIKNGSLTSEHVQHLNGMYPEVTKFLTDGLTNKITEIQAKGGAKPPLAIREGLSLLMGTPLSSETTPRNMMAAQAALQGSKAAQQASQAPAKSSKAPLAKTGQSMQTGTQSLVARSQRLT